jgi:hypothetical protein
MARPAGAQVHLRPQAPDEENLSPGTILSVRCIWPRLWKKGCDCRGHAQCILARIQIFKTLLPSASCSTRRSFGF